MRYPNLPKIDSAALLKEAKSVEDLPRRRRVSPLYEGRQDYIELLQALPIGKAVELDMMYYKSLSSICSRLNKGAVDKVLKVRKHTDTNMCSVSAIEKAPEMSYASWDDLNEARAELDALTARGEKE